MNVRKAEDRLLFLALVLIAAGLAIGIGGWAFGLKALSEVVTSAAGSAGIRPRIGLNVVMICVFIGTFMLLDGFLLLVAAVGVHFTQKRKPPVIS